MGYWNLLTLCINPASTSGKVRDMSTPSTHPDYMSIESQNIEISAVVEIDMLRKRYFLNTSAERVKRGAFSKTYRTNLCPDLISWHPISGGCYAVFNLASMT